MIKMNHTFVRKIDVHVGLYSKRNKQKYIALVLDLSLPKAMASFLIKFHKNDKKY